MVHLKKAKGGYMIVTIAKNGEILSTSEIIKTKQDAINNFLSQKAEMSSFEFIESEIMRAILTKTYAYYQDDTGAAPAIYRIRVDLTTNKIVKKEKMRDDELKVLKIKIKNYLKK
jgi:uncharacterized protein YegP (UPF0339 family)